MNGDGRNRAFKSGIIPRIVLRQSLRDGYGRGNGDRSWNQILGDSAFAS
jgi:hypothetical protein